MRFLVTGASGLLGRWVSRELDREGLTAAGWCRSRPEPGCVPVDLTRPDLARAAFVDARPDVVLHLAAMSAMSDCAKDPEAARAINATAVQTITALAEGARARLVVVSTDLVFDGEDAPYDEPKPANATSVYGRTKREGETFALAYPGALVVRVSLLYGPALGSRRGFFDAQLDALRRGEKISLFEDEWRTPLALDAAARTLVALARHDATGLLHLGGPERMSRSEMGVRLARIAGADESCIMRAYRLSAPGEPRARDVSLTSVRLAAILPQLARAPFEEACRAMLS